MNKRHVHRWWGHRGPAQQRASEQLRQLGHQAVGLTGCLLTPPRPPRSPEDGQQRATGQLVDTVACEALAELHAPIERAVVEPLQPEPPAAELLPPQPTVPMVMPLLRPDVAHSTALRRTPLPVRAAAHAARALQDLPHTAS